MRQDERITAQNSQNNPNLFEQAETIQMLSKNQNRNCRISLFFEASRKSCSQGVRGQNNYVLKHSVENYSFTQDGLFLL